MKDMDKTEENLIEETASEEKKSRLNTSVLKKLVEEDDGKASKDKEDNGSFVEIEENKSEDKKEDKKKAAPRKKTSADKYLKSEVYDSRKKNKKLRKFFNNALVVLAAIVLGYALTTFCFCTVYMSGPSMEKTLSHGDELIMSKLAYLVGNVERYDIVAIQKLGSTEYYDIKRVIGLPGDTVSVVGGVLIVNGKQVDTELPSYYVDSLGRLSKPVELGKDEYFVLGDNPDYSVDSRFVNFGNILKSEIKGKIIYRILPTSKSGRIKAIED